MHTSDMVKSKFWRAIDLKGKPPVRLTIADVSEEFFNRGGRQETKCFLWFQENLKGLPLNKSRVAVLEMAFGPDSVMWTGKRVRLTFDPTVIFAGQAVGGVKLETPPGVVYDEAAAGSAAWGDAPSGNAPGRPPQPVWDEQRQTWITPQPKPAQPAPSNRPPPPVWNEGTKSWEFVDASTGEINGAAPQRQGPPPTISQRVAAAHPPNDDRWGPSDSVGAAPVEDFNDDISDIPF